jgi:hypothetical protein
VLCIPGCFNIRKVKKSDDFNYKVLSSGFADRGNIFFGMDGVNLMELVSDAYEGLIE